MLKKRWVKITLLAVGIVIAFLVIAGLVCTQVCLNEEADLAIDGPVHQSWVQRYKGEYSGDFDTSRALDVAAGDDGCVYVTGEDRANAAGIDYATIKYDAKGNEMWVAHYDGGWSDTASAIALDGSGNAYVTGTCGPGHEAGARTDSNCVTIKYDAEGNQEWVACYAGAAAREIVVDGEGNVYVAATAGGASWWPTFQWRTSYATIKYDSEGNQLWVVLHKPSDESWEARDIAIDDAGNVYVTGHSSDSSTSWGDYETVKYDSVGKQLWAVPYGPTGAVGEACDVAVDEKGNVYVAGYMASAGPPRCNGYAVLKYDSSGSQLWVARYEGKGETVGMVVSDQGDVYVVGRGEGPTDGGIALKYDTEGKLLWAAESKYEDCQAYAMTVDGAGNVYVAGQHCSIIKYDPEGKGVWAVVYDRTSQNGDNWSVAVDSGGNVYVVGSWHLGILSGADPFGHNQTAYYVAKYRQGK